MKTGAHEPNSGQAMNDQQARIETLFLSRIGKRPGRTVVRSPGRVNLIGEHTDYNEGFVLPASVNKTIIFAVSPRTDGIARFIAADLNDEFESSLAEIHRSSKGWPNYLLGVIEEYRLLGHTFPGCDAVFGGDIPIGAGMSSSAAVECGFAFALNQLFGFALGKMDLVKLGQRSENNFAGMNCGIMDQFINIFGANRTALKIDCRSLEHEHFPFERSDLAIVLCETELKRSLASSEYNIRRQQCEKGVAILQKHKPEIHSLRDVSVEYLQEHCAEMDPITYRRCDYVIKENERVLQACENLRKNDFRAFGEKMFRSHSGLRDDYQVSSPDLAFLVEAAATIPGVLGARMMGAGFGGCTINLVELSSVPAFVEEIQSRYRQRTGMLNNVYVTRIESGTSLLLPCE
jgi:galactokinase